MPTLARLLALGTLLVAAAALRAAAPTNPETEYRALLALARAQLPAWLQADEEAKIAWLQRRKTELHTRGAAFRAQHPAHPLRWDVLVLLRYGGEERVKIWRRGFRQLLPVPESLAAWNRFYFAEIEALLAAPDAGAAAREEALRQLIDHTARGALGKPADAPAAISRVGALLRTYETEFPRSGRMLLLYHAYTDLLESADPGHCIKYLADLERRYPRDEPLDRDVRKLVAGRRRVMEAQALPIDGLWQQLRSFDPVRGDPARYRNQVVLVAFGPVTYDTLMDSLEDLHAQYAAQGLVILQVASFNQNLGLPPAPEQRRNLEHIVAVRKWPWPILWNPAGHMQLVQQWGFNTVPARMLLGRDGRLVPDRHTPFSISIPRELARAPDQP